MRCTDEELREALRRAYVAGVFSPELDASMLDLLLRFEDAMALRIKNLEGIKPQTTEQARKKPHGIRSKIGIPTCGA